MMKLLTGSVFAALVLSTVAGCGSADKGGVAGSSSSALATLQNPTGTFDKSTGNQAFAGYQSNKRSSSGVAGSAGSQTSGQSTAQSIRFLANKTGNCSEGQSCACPGGGSYKFQVTRTESAAELNLEMSACVFETGDAFDGTALLVQSQKPLLVEEKAQAASPPAKSSVSKSSIDQGGANLLAMEGTATIDKKATPVKLVYLEQEGTIYLSVEVPSGSLVIGVSADGRAVVHAKDKTWTCNSGARGYTCKSDDGAADEEIEVDASASAASSSSSSGSESDPSDSYDSYDADY